ncbi:MAG: SIR2 family protein [Anditalea sp.]
MFSKDEEKYLIRQIGNNQVLLFLGAGFSRDAFNINGQNFPSAWELGKLMWKILGYPGDYDNTSLPEMYQAFLDAPIKLNDKKQFLESNLLSSSIPDYYDTVAIPLWFKIYTINVDDILTVTFKKSTIPIDELCFPHDEFKERDQSLERRQINYLHGKLPCEPSEVVFSSKQYAKAQLANQPLYGQFVYDYASLPTIFLGTELDEPLFTKYIEAREGRFGFKELRPKSFLITPRLSPVKIGNLKNNYNVHHITGTTKEFCQWLNAINDELPSKTEVLKRTFPSLLSALEFADIAGISKKAVTEFARTFNRIPRELQKRNIRSGFLEGSSPRWNDIISELDVPRSITEKLIENIEKQVVTKNKSEKTKLNIISGYAGSGKSTLIKRLGLTLSQNGHTVFLSYSDFFARVNEISEVLSCIDDRVVLIFDNGINAISILNNLIIELNQKLKYAPVIILALRSNYTQRLKERDFADKAEVIEYSIPNLDDQEIKYLIEKLDEENLLGVLKGMSEGARIRQFKKVANRQILIAMKEATEGKSFDKIMSTEFNSLEPTEVKILCTCLALNTEHGYHNSRQDFIGFSSVSHIETLNYLEGVMKGTVLWIGDESRFMLRHRVLADFIINTCASPDILKDAYIRVLSVLAPELTETKNKSKKFGLFKHLINHRVLYRRFKEDIEHAREVYDSISSFFDHDAQFWLQYGSLEVEGKGGDLYKASNYLNQAESLAPNSDYIKNAQCNLLYRKAHLADDRTKALELYSDANNLARSQILSIGREEPYIYHIYCSGRYLFIRKWITNRTDKIIELDELKSAIKTATSFHPLNRKLNTLSLAINRAYLQMGLISDLEEPELPKNEK